MKGNSSILSSRSRRVLVYTAALLGSPLPVMPYVKGTREYALAVMACGLLLALASFYVARGEWRIKPRSTLGDRLLITSTITCLFGMMLLAWAAVFLLRG